MTVIKTNNHRKCEICNKTFPEKDLFPITLVRDSLIEKLKKINPELSTDGMICAHDLSIARSSRIEELILEDKGELSKLEMEVLRSFEEHEILAENLNIKLQRSLTFGEKLSDKIAKFGGSWKFIILFLSLIIIWMIFNTWFFLKNPLGSFDPYPYILLNLILSCLAAIQAPIIMMSQNRQAERDRMKADYEYTTNLKAELEVRQLNAKVDQLMKKHWSRLLEIQQMQLDLAEELLSTKKRKKE